MSVEGSKQQPPDRRCVMTPYIDLHCDTLMQAWMGRKKDIMDLPKAMLDLRRLQNSGCRAQFFAVFMPPITLKKYLGPLFPKDDRYIQRLYDIFQNTLKQHGDILAFAGNTSEMERNRDAGRISAMLTLEDGRGVDGSIERLEQFYRMGVRLITLTWNSPNCFGYPNSDDPLIMNMGLTDFGKDAVVRMNELGILVDVSHLSDGGFADVAVLSKKPFVASHSNCRELSPHRRNLTDEMLRTLAKHGGVAGINFAPRFLNADITCMDSRMELIAAHLRHMIKVGGLGCAAIGTDFDGVKGSFEVASVDKMPLLFYRLEQGGFTADEIEHIAWKNAMRVLRETL